MASRWSTFMLLTVLLLRAVAAAANTDAVFPIDHFRLQESLDSQSVMLFSDSEDAADIMTLPVDQWKPMFNDDRLRDTHTWLWTRVKLQNRLQVPLRVTVQLKASLFQSVNFFVLDQNTLIDQSHHSSMTRAFGKSFADLWPTHTLSLEPGAERLILVSLRSDAPHDFSWEVIDNETYERDAMQHSLLGFVLLVMLLLIALFALFQGIVQKRSIPLALALFVSLCLLLMVRMTHSPLLALFWEPLGLVLPPVNHILCGVQASLLVLLRRLTHGLEPKVRLQKFYWLTLGFYVLYLSLVVLVHRDQSLLFMLPSQILLVTVLLIIDRLTTQQNHPRRRMIRVLLGQQSLLVCLKLLIVAGYFPLWYLPDVALWIYVISCCGLLFMGMPAYRAESVATLTPTVAPINTNTQPSSEAKPNLLHEQWLHAEKMAALGTFTNGLANELNNPLAIIAGHRFRLSSMIDSRSFNIHEFEKSLGKVDQAVNRMIAVIDALKVYSQDPQGQEIFKTFSIRETIKYTIDLCRDKVLSRGIKLSTPELGDATMEGHQGQIIQVLLILVDNAIDVLEATTEKTIRIELQPLPDTIRVAVIDSGAGVPLGLRGKIWDPFFTTKDPFRHKGLGLSIASGIISNHRGRILLDESTPESRFVVELPRTRRSLGPLQDTTSP